MTNAVTLASIAGTGYLRNRIINGNMAIDQRNAGGAITSGYPVDRWRQDSTGQASFSYQQNGGAVTPPTGFTNYLAATSTAAYSPATNTTCLLNSSIEGRNMYDLAWGTAGALTVTLSFWVRSSLTGTHSGSIANGGGNRSYVFSFTISSANTWEYKTITIPGDTTGTWPTDTTAWGGVRFNLGSGTGTYGTTTTGWQAGNPVGLTTAVQVSSVNGATFYVTGTQLEVGTQATPFEWRPYQTEFLMCKRYYQQYNCGASWGSANAVALTATKFATTDSMTVNLSTDCPFRTAPTITLAKSTARAVLSSGIQNVTVGAFMTNAAGNGPITGSYNNNSLNPGYGWIDDIGTIYANAEI